LLVADAGMLRGRPATTHRLFAGELRRRYPDVEVRVDRMVIDHGDVITSGGATFLNLVLYLVERFGGHERANLAAKVLLVDGHRVEVVHHAQMRPDVPVNARSVGYPLGLPSVGCRCNG
jgi:transcriptional regulator GlxA family with amidase domain